MKKIREFAKLCGTSAKTLRFYDKLGILEAEYINPDNGYRYYSDDQKERFARIRVLQDIGFTLDEIKCDLMNAEEEHILEILRRKEQELQRACELCAQQIRYYDGILQSRRNYEAGKTCVQRQDDENRIVVLNKETSRTFAVQSEAMDMCFRTLYTLFAEPCTVGSISLADIPEFSGEDRTVFVQVLDGDIDELLSSEWTAFFSESNKVADINNVIFSLTVGSDVQLALIDELTSRLASCFSDNASIIWGCNIETHREGHSVGIAIIGIY